MKLTVENGETKLATEGEPAELAIFMAQLNKNSQKLVVVDKKAKKQYKKKSKERAHKRWTAVEEKNLKDMKASNATIAYIATELKRTRGSVKARLYGLGLL